MAKIDPDDPRAPYLQIADDLRRAIRAGEYRPGQRMASNRDLATEYGVAPMTVHQAMRVLRDEGLVASYQGRGVFVETPSGGMDAIEVMDPHGRALALARKIESLESRVEGTEEQVREEIADLRRQLGVFQAQLIDLYARTGHQYPRDGESRQAEASPRRRRASGA